MKFILRFCAIGEMEEKQNKQKHTEKMKKKIQLYSTKAKTKIVCQQSKEVGFF